MANTVRDLLPPLAATWLIIVTGTSGFCMSERKVRTSPSGIPAWLRPSPAREHKITGLKM